MASITIHWDDLGKVAAASLAFGVGIVVFFSLGVLSLSRIEGMRERGETAVATWYALAGVAFAVCASAVVYGLYLIIPQFH